MQRPEWGTAPIECASPVCDWRGTEKDLVPDPNHKPAPRGRINAVKNGCPKCGDQLYYFPDDPGEHSVAWEKGESAHWASRPASANPYPAGSEDRAQWERGRASAEREASS